MKLILTRRAEKDLDRLDEITRIRVIKAIERLVKSPENTDIKKLKGMEVFRLRIGDYRVCFEIDKEAKAIIILRVRHRKESYR